MTTERDAAVEEARERVERQTYPHRTALVALALDAFERAIEARTRLTMHELSTAPYWHERAEAAEAHLATAYQGSHDLLNDYARIQAALKAELAEEVARRRALVDVMTHAANVLDAFVQGWPREEVPDARDALKALREARDRALLTDRAEVTDG